MTFEDRVASYYDRLMPYAIMRLRSRVMAEDVVQNTMMRALRAKHQFTEDTNFSGWIYTILRNEITSTWRRGSRREETGGIDVATWADDSLMEPSRPNDRHDEEQLLAKIGALRPDWAWCLIGVTTGLNYEEIAVMMNTTVGTVKSRLWRARACLAAILELEGLTV